MGTPGILYKYQRYSPLSLEGLITGSIWVSTPSNFNDPFDCQHKVEVDVDEKKIETLLSEFFSGMPEEFRRNSVRSLLMKEGEHRLISMLAYIEGVVAGIGPTGVYCLTETNSDLLMWAHYADSHRGFIVGYDCTSKPISEKMVSLLPVKYSGDYPKIHLRDLVFDGKKCAKIMATHKGLQWRYEKEWRLIYSKGNYSAVTPWQITEIIFGYRMKIEDANEIYHSVTRTNKDVRFYVTEPDHATYRLNILPFDENIVMKPLQSRLTRRSSGTPQKRGAP